MGFGRFMCLEKQWSLSHLFTPQGLGTRLLRPDVRINRRKNKRVPLSSQDLDGRRASSYEGGMLGLTGYVLGHWANGLSRYGHWRRSPFLSKGGEDTDR